MNKKQIMHELAFLAAFLNVVLVGLSVFAVMLGLHHIDNAWNMKYAESITGDKWVDKQVLGNEYHSTGNVYEWGLVQVTAGSGLLAASMYLLGKMHGVLYEKTRHRK